MKLSHLKQLLAYFEKFKKISAIYRVSDTIVKIVFDKDDEIFFDMRRYDAKIFKCHGYSRSKVYSAPFDVVLAKRFNNASLERVELVNGDKVLLFKTKVSSSYKQEVTFLQLEFTGKHTNAIILDEHGVILEALRHIDLFSSFREVRVGQKLLPLPSPSFEAKEYPLEDLESFLYKEYEKETATHLDMLKKQKCALLEKKLKRYEELLESLESEDELMEESKRFGLYGSLMLGNMQKIRPYATVISLEDYDGSTVVFELPREFATVPMMVDFCFARSKKRKQKAEYLHLERESLKSKIHHTKLFINTVSNTNDVGKIDLLFPKAIQTKKSVKNDSIEIFWIEGYKVALGKNEKGNIKLLQEAKAKDIWLHMKDMPSAHVIIFTDKQSLPPSIIASAARLCVEFTVFAQGRYLVDYTQRREVSVQESANVFYNKYKTIEVDTCQ